MKAFGILVLGFCLSGAAAESGKPTAEDIAAGKALFDVKCAVCHSPDSKEKRVGPGLKGVKDGKLPSGRNATHDVILNQLNVGGPGLSTTAEGLGMPIFKDLLTEKEKDRIIAYVMSL